MKPELEPTDVDETPYDEWEPTWSDLAHVLGEDEADRIMAERERDRRKDP